VRPASGSACGNFCWPLARRADLLASLDAARGAGLSLTERRLLALLARG
jgi:hypothetical protein